MSATRASTFLPGLDAGRLVDDLLTASGDALQVWQADRAAPPRLALRRTAEEPVGELTLVGVDDPLEVSDLVVVVEPRAEGPELVAAYAESTPAWALGGDPTLRLIGVQGTVCPYPALQQLGLCWLGQGWDSDGLRGIREALVAWRTVDRSGLPGVVAEEVARLRADTAGEEPFLAGLLGDLGVAVPYTDPVTVLDAVAVACA